MMNPFMNDPFAMVYDAFKRLYPDRDCECYFDVIEENERGEKVFGETLYFDDGRITIGVDVRLCLADAVEIFAHELAHVAAGSEAEHNEEWEKAFDAIHQKYNEIGNELFDKHTPVTVVNGKVL